MQNEVIADIKQILQLTKRTSLLGDTRSGWDHVATKDRLPEIQRIAKALLHKLDKPTGGTDG